MKRLLGIFLSLMILLTLLPLAAFAAEEYDIGAVELPTPKAPNYFIYTDGDASEGHHDNLRMIMVTDPEVALLAAEYLWLKYHAKVDKDLQGMYDYLSTAKKMNIEHAEQIGDRIADVGKQMNALRQERARHKKSTEKHKQLIDAYRTYTRFRPLVEGVKEPQASAIGEYTKAYTVLVQNQILTAEAYALLCRRYKFEKQKIVDYTKRMPLLKRQYHDLKRLEALAIHPTKYLQEIYSYSERAYLYAPQDNRSVDNILHEAYTRSAESIRKSVEEKSIDTK